MKDEILYLYLNKELDAEEQAQVEEWIKQNPEHFQKIKTIWEKAALDQSKAKPDTNKMWGNIISEIEQPKVQKQGRKLPAYRSLLKYAAIFLLGLGLIGYIAHREAKRVQWIEYASVNDVPEEIELPDGSTVTLNKESSLLYKKQRLSSTREVKLTGEAFFDVEKDPDRPFIINVNNTIVKVLGTSFAIDASDSAGAIIVSVKTGKVMFYKKDDPSDSVYLYPGDMGLLASSEQKISKSEIHDLNYMAWKTRVLLFKGNTLPEVCEVISKYYGSTIMVDHPDLLTRKLTARYQDKSLDEVLELLKIALDIQYEEKEDTVLLTCK